MYSYMEPQFHHHHHHHHNHNQHQQHNSGLLRFRSAPSSPFSEFTQSPTRSGEEFLDSSYESKPHPQSLDSSQNGYSGSGQLPPQHPKHHMGSGLGPDASSIQRSNSLEIDRHGGLNLSRQSSSPAGLFSHLMHHQNGFTIMGGVGNFRVGNGTNGESSPHLSRLTMSHLPQIPETANDSIKETRIDDDVIKFRKQEDEPGFESPARYPFASWHDSGSDSSRLSEMAVVEKLFHFQDTVPCKVRAKRGCATHPRSIAERVRRNRITERMRKLQGLVPNMDKQTNTADMLDLAVEYIKNLQNQHKVLSENRAKCNCVNLKHSLAS